MIELRRLPIGAKLYARMIGHDLVHVVIGQPDPQRPEKSCTVVRSVSTGVERRLWGRVLVGYLPDRGVWAEERDWLDATQTLQGSQESSAGREGQRSRAVTDVSELEPAT